MDMDNINIYEYGCEVTQDNPNDVYKCFELLQNDCEKNDVYIYNDEVKDRKSKGTKITGAIVAEVFRKNIEYILKKNNLEDIYKVSENNVYVKGCSTEFDFLILKKDAQKVESNNNDNNINFELPIYDWADVIAVLESKTYGIYSLYNGRTENTNDEIQKNDLYKFVSEYEKLRKKNNNIKIGYMCLVEQRPNKGKSNFIEKTIYFFEDYFGKDYGDPDKSWYIYFSKCHFSNKTPDRYASDDAWEKFVMNLVQ